MGRLGAPLAALLADLFPPMGHLGLLEGVLGLCWGSCGRLLGGPFLFHGSFLVLGGILWEYLMSSWHSSGLLWAAFGLLCADRGWLRASF